MEHREEEVKDEIRKVREILSSSPLVDGHNDTPWRYLWEHKGVLDSADFSKDTSGVNPIMMTDIPRMRKGGMGGQFWSAFILDKWAGKGASEKILKQVDLIQELTRRHPEDLETAASADDVERIHASGKIASLIGIEGGHSIENSINVLRELGSRGARYMTLGCSRSNEIADSPTGERLHGGLSEFGKEVVLEMNRLGMMVDLSHTTDEVVRDVLEITKAPPIFSHSSCRALCSTLRNVPDDLMRKVAEKGGIIMITFVTMFITEGAHKVHMKKVEQWKRLEEKYPGDEEKVKQELKEWSRDHPYPPVSLSDVADHIEHACRIAGKDHVGLGSDFAGFRHPPRGLEDVSCYPALLAELLRRGFSEGDIKKIAGKNILNVMRRVERIAGEMNR